MRSQRLQLSLGRTVRITLKWAGTYSRTSETFSPGSDNVPPRSNRAFLLDELGTVPTDARGVLRIDPVESDGESFAAIGLRFTGAIFSTVPAQ